MYSIIAQGQTSVLRKANFMKWINVICALMLFALPVQAASVRYQHTDMLGSVVSESDESGNIISRSQYEPFGKRMGGDKEGIGYTGHLQDKDLGLTYMQARYYDPLIGRFYSNDPVGFDNVHNFNRYSYANNNPYKYIDPDGRDSFLVSRALKGFPIGNHNFIVSHAKYLGDPNAKVYSWGPLESGKMGLVNHVNSGGAARTWEDDSSAWQSLSFEGNSGVAFRAIDASDSDVSFLASTVQENRNYKYVPSLFTGSVNSNSAAGAVAHAADGGTANVPTGGWQPGHNQSSMVNVGNSPPVFRVSGRLDSRKLDEELN